MAIEVEQALNEMIGVLHLVDRLGSKTLGEPFVAPVVEHLGVEEVLVDGSQLCREYLVEEFDDLGVTLHVSPSVPVSSSLTIVGGPVPGRARRRCSSSRSCGRFPLRCRGLEQRLQQPMAAAASAAGRATRSDLGNRGGAGGDGGVHRPIAHRLAVTDDHLPTDPRSRGVRLAGDRSGVESPRHRWGAFRHECCGQRQRDGDGPWGADSRPPPPRPGQRRGRRRTGPSRRVGGPLRRIVLAFPSASTYGTPWLKVWPAYMLGRPKVKRDAATAAPPRCAFIS